MSSTEIEDVLSSIRRLVSDDLRPISRPQPAPVSDPGKLLLTPALRVVQDSSAPRRTEFSSTRTGADSALPVFVATRRVHVVDAAKPAAVEPVAPDAAEAPFVEAEPAPLEKVVASLGAAVTAQPEDWEPEHGDAPIATAFSAEIWGNTDFIEAAEVEVRAESDTDPAPVATQEEGPVAAELPVWAQDDGVEAEPAYAETEAPAYAETEAEAELYQATIEPDPEWADAAEASVIAALQAEAENVQARQTASEDFSAEPELEMRYNEDVLRELVRDILREELAGQMGERITRNIRKLVRSEIALILATRDFEMPDGN